MAMPLSFTDVLAELALDRDIQRAVVTAKVYSPLFFQTGFQPLSVFLRTGNPRVPEKILSGSSIVIFICAPPSIHIRQFKSNNQA